MDDGPYVRSVLVRDAAVTSWIHVATSPIYGNVGTILPAPGQRVGEDGRIVAIRNDRADRSGVERAKAEVSRAETLAAELRGRLASSRGLDAERQEMAARYAEALHLMLDLDVDILRRELALIDRRLALTQSLADRRIVLVSKGGSSQSHADEAMVEVAELELQRAQWEDRVAQTELRKAKAA